MRNMDRPPTDDLPRFAAVDSDDDVMDEALSDDDADLDDDDDDDDEDDDEDKDDDDEDNEGGV